MDHSTQLPKIKIKQEQGRREKTNAGNCSVCFIINRLESSVVADWLPSTKSGTYYRSSEANRAMLSWMAYEISDERQVKHDEGSWSAITIKHHLEHRARTQEEAVSPREEYMVGHVFLHHLVYAKLDSHPEYGICHLSSRNNVTQGDDLTSPTQHILRR